MSGDPFAALPEAKRDIVRAALSAAFGAVRIDAIAPVSGGATGAAPLRVDMGERRYIVRVEGAPSPLRNPHQYDSLRIAAMAGIAPRLHFVDENTRVAVMDFIEPRPLSAFPGGPHALVQALGELLQRLQAMPTFPSYVDYPDIVARLFGHVRRTGLFGPGILDAHGERLARVSEAYAAGVTRLVASHNDLIPANIMFDGQRLWLIDWESAYRNDPLVDISTVLDTLAPTAELEDALLRTWLGRAPDAAIRSRLELVRALTRLYYAGVFLSASAAASWTKSETDLSAPSTVEFRKAIGEGRLKAGTPQTKHILGKMFLASFFWDVPAPGFDAAV